MANRGKLKGKTATREVINRPVRFHKYEQICLIVCEDEQTEPNYFGQFINFFPLHTLYIECIGTGRDALGVIEATISQKKSLEKRAKKEVDFTWAVFDKDSADENKAKIKRFTDAFLLAERNAINTAFSNEVFELWLLLHLKSVSHKKPIPRADIYTDLENSIRKKEGDSTFKYIHGSCEILEKIKKLGNEQKAIERAMKLEEKFKDIEPIKANPSTKVHYLIKELRALITYYNWSE